MIPKPGARFVDFPEVISPAEFAKRFGWSERRVRSLAREIGAWPHSGQSYDPHERRCRRDTESDKAGPFEPASAFANDLLRGSCKTTDKAGSQSWDAAPGPLPEKTEERRLTRQASGAAFAPHFGKRACHWFRRAE
jgi:hypothetical protein